LVDYLFFAFVTLVSLFCHNCWLIYLLWLFRFCSHL
jgi:hypothetical protein